MDRRGLLPTALLVAWGGTLSAQWINYPTPRTRDGKPDSSGIGNPDYASIPRAGGEDEFVRKAVGSSTK